MSFARHPFIAAGAAQVASPDGSGLIPPDLFAEYAAIVLLDPEPPLLASWVSRLERKLARRAEARPWAILRVTPGMERKVRDALTDDGLTVYVPMERYRPRNRPNARLRPLIPGYAFADLRSEADLDIARGNHAVDLMCRDGKPVGVPALEIGSMIFLEALRAFDTAKDAKPQRSNRSRRGPPLRNWEKGQRVMISDGPYAGRIGEIVKAERIDRIEMLISAFGGLVELKLDEVMLVGGADE